MPACDKATFIMLHNAIPPSFHSSGSETSERARGDSSLFKLLHMCTSRASLPPSLPPSGLVPHYHNVSKSRTPRTAALLVPLQPKSDLSGARRTRERGTMLLHSDRSPCDALGSTWVPSWVKLFYPIVEGSNACLFLPPQHVREVGCRQSG